MTRIIIFIAAISLGIFACSPEPNSNTDKLSKSITLEVTDSQILLLDKKEVHIDFLNSVLSDIKNDFDITANLRISPQTPMEIVYNVQKSLNLNTVRISENG
jgi:biopolymer transport protein ExbD